MENFEAKIETEEQTTVKKKWSPPTRKKIKTGNTLHSNTTSTDNDGTKVDGWYNS